MNTKRHGWPLTPPLSPSDGEREIIGGRCYPGWRPRRPYPGLISGTRFGFPIGARGASDDASSHDYREEISSTAKAKPLDT